MKPKFTVSRVTNDRFSLVTDVLMSDGSYQSDAFMGLSGNVLKSREERGLIRVGGLMKLTLGPVSLAAVKSLQVGQSITL